MADLVEGQFELDGAASMWAQSAGAGPVRIIELDTGDADIRDQDSDNPVDDGRMFGTDYATPPTWTFTLGVYSGSDLSSIPLEALQAAWRNRSVRRTPGAKSVLRYRLHGRTRRVYGRGRKFSADNTRLLDNNYLQALAEFVLAEPFSYDDEEDSLHLGLVTDPGGTLTWPITFPITFGATPGLRQGIVNVAGEAETPFRAVISGPVTGKAVSPVLKGHGWRIELPGLEVHYDETVEIDTRARTVSKNGVSVVHFLSRRSDLSARLMPGSQELVFTTTDPTNTAAARMYWRAAHWSL